MAEWVTRSQRVAYSNPWITVREDVVTFPNGKEGMYGVVAMADTVAIIPRRDSAICLVNQYRYTVRKASWELPSGHIHPGENPLGAAKRELGEEAGLEAATWTDLGFVHPALGVMATTRYIYLAENLQAIQTGHEDSESGMLVHWFDLDEVLRMIRTNEIFDDYLLAALCKLNNRGT